MMRLTLVVAALSEYASAFLASPVHVAPVAVRSSAAMRTVRMDERELSEYEKYQLKRGEASFERAEEGYKSFKGIDQEFDGGDSGGGVVGDGNTDLEDQHNSATLGALRGGIADFTGTTMQVGRGQVNYVDLPDEATKETGATEARTASAGKNYFGRSTGLADKIIENMSEDDVRNGKCDKVRAQQKENWFNQRAIHRVNRQNGQGVVFGEVQEGRPTEGGYIARDALSSQAWRNGAKDGESLSQRDLANHLSDLAAAPAARLDGQVWDEIAVAPTEEVDETFEVRASPRSTAVTTIAVRNDYNTFAPFQCDFVAGSSSAFTVSPNHGSMNRRSGEPIEVIVRYSPDSPGEVLEGTLVFETEDMRKVYKFVGST